MIHESPYDQREQEARDEDRRQALQDAGEDDMNERRQFGMAHYWWEWTEEERANYEYDRQRSPPDDLTNNETRGE